jgi:glucose-6-phosphate isomerase
MSEDFTTLGTAPAAGTLRRLAAEPFDLTRDDALLDHSRLERYICESGPFRLLYATQKVDEAVLDGLQELADQCGLVEQFNLMRSGAVMNRIEGWECENRQVLHTACRDLFSDTPKAPDATALMRAELGRLKTFLAELERGEVVNADGETFTTMVNVGIGGSDLGPRAIYEALRPFGLAGRTVHFVANVDPDDAARVLDSVDLRRTLINVVSKSGTTLETLTNELLVTGRLRAAGLDPARHCLAVTGQGSPMDNPDKYLRSFYMYDYIGGRYSATSMVGAVMLGFFLGFDQLRAFLEGAAAIDDHAGNNTSIRHNIPLLMALLGIWNRNFLGMPTMAVLPYSQALHRFPAHLQQCDMESNGKSLQRQGKPVGWDTGPVVWGEPGTNGQHAFYQLLHQGTEVVPVEFIGFRQSQYQQDLEVQGTTSQQKLFANLLAQAISLAIGKSSENPNRYFPGNRPSLVLIADRLDPTTMGALLAIYEAKIIFQGFAWNINSFDQEGVQLGKILAGKFLKAMTGGTEGEDAVETRFLKAAAIAGNSGN